MTTDQLERRVRLLTAWAVGTTLLAVGLIVGGFSSGSVAQWTEIRAEETTIDTLRATHIAAERIDVVESDDTLAISLSNSEHTPAPRFEGNRIQAFAGDRNMPSIIFFDGHGDEVGGLAFKNTESEDGHSASRYVSMNGYEQNQVVMLEHTNENGKETSGLRIQDRPDVSVVQALNEVGLTPSSSHRQFGRKIAAFRKEHPARFQELFGAPLRAFIGRTEEGSARLALHDQEGRPRIRAEVDSSGTARLVFLDADGNVSHQYPPK